MTDASKDPGRDSAYQSAAARAYDNHAGYVAQTVEQAANEYTEKVREQCRDGHGELRLYASDIHRAYLAGAAKAPTASEPTCEACGKPAVVQYDTEGEGKFWLCERRDGDHDDDHYCGVEVRRLAPAATQADLYEVVNCLGEMKLCPDCTQHNLGAIAAIQGVVEATEKARPGGKQT